MRPLPWTPIRLTAVILALTVVASLGGIVTEGL